jgi:hypothetical protein
LVGDDGASGVVDLLRERSGLRSVLERRKGEMRGLGCGFGDG